MEGKKTRFTYFFYPVMEKKQINPRHPGSESLSAHRGRTKKKENNPALYSTITGHIFSFLLLLLFFWCFCLHRAGTLLHPQPLHHLHLNNKLKPVKFRHCDYQSNCIIDLPHLKKKTELTVGKVVINVISGTRLWLHVAQCARESSHSLDLKIYVEILGSNKSWVPLAPFKIGQFAAISLELLWENASRFPPSTRTMIMVVQPIIIIF